MSHYDLDWYPPPTVTPSSKDHGWRETIILFPRRGIDGVMAWGECLFCRIDGVKRYRAMTKQERQDFWCGREWG